ncbi:MAG: TlpA family protein disulfide reductase [Chloroflexi bacterium]|nr:TlpA family protein disulfide reductase [Chloroflexota bacterium]
MANDTPRPPLIPLRLVPLALLPIIGLLGALLLVLDQRNDGDDGSGAASFASPEPVTFIPPTRLPPPTDDGVPDGLFVINRAVPDLTLTTLDGERIVLRDLAGEVVFLNLWATWCPPCEAEMPDLQALDDSGAARVFTLTDPTNEQDEAAIRAFIDRFDLTLPVALSTDADVFNELQQGLPLRDALPTTLIVDPAGVIRYGHVGQLFPNDIAYYLEQVNAE